MEDIATSHTVSQSLSVINGVYVLCSAYHGHLTLLKQISSHKLAAQGGSPQSAASHVSIVS